MNNYDCLSLQYGRRNTKLWSYYCSDTGKNLLQELSLQLHLNEEFVIQFVLCKQKVSHSSYSDLLDINSYTFKFLYVF